MSTLTSPNLTKIWRGHILSFVDLKWNDPSTITKYRYVKYNFETAFITLHTNIVFIAIVLNLLVMDIPQLMVSRSTMLHRCAKWTYFYCGLLTCILVQGQSPQISIKPDFLRLETVSCKTTPKHCSEHLFFGNVMCLWLNLLQTENQVLISSGSGERLNWIWNIFWRFFSCNNYIRWISV